MMKKRLTIVALLAALLPLGAWAQVAATLQLGMESRTLSEEFVQQAVLVGTYNGMELWYGPDRAHRSTLVLADHNMMQMGSVELGRNADLSLVAASVDSGQAYLLMADESRSERTVLRSIAVDLESMLPATKGQPWVTVDSVGYGRHDIYRRWAARSADGRLTAVVSIVEYKDKKQYSASVRLLDEQMRTLWVREYAMGTTDEVAVADDGTVVSLGMEQGNGVVDLVYNVVRRDGGATYEVSLESDPLTEVHLAGIVGRHAMGVGLFRPANSRAADELCGGIVGFSFHIDSAALSGFTMRPFQNEDMNILYNEKTKKIQREQVADLVGIDAYAPMPYGAAIVVGRSFQLQYETDNGLWTSDHRRMGLHVVAVDTLGRVLWVRNVRRNDMQKGADALLRVALCHQGDATLLLKSESPKLPPTYEIGKPAKLFTMGDKGNTALYRISDGGEVAKQVLIGKSRYSLLQAYFDPQGRLVLIDNYGKRSRRSLIELQ